MCNNYTYRGNHMIYIIIALTIHCCIRVDIPENKRDTQTQPQRFEGIIETCKKELEETSRNMRFGNATLIGRHFVHPKPRSIAPIFLSISIPRAQRRLKAISI